MRSGIDGIRIESSPGQDKTFQSDPGSEHNRVGAVPGAHGIPCITFGQTDVLDYLVDDLESCVPGKHKIGVIAVSTCQVIISRATSDYVIVERAEYSIVSSAAIHEIAGVVVAPAVCPHEVVALARHDDGGAAVTVFENVVRRAAGYLLDGECRTIGI